MGIPAPTRVGVKERRGEEENVVDIHLYRYKIRSGQTGGIDSDMCAMEQVNIDLGFLFDTKITGGINTGPSPEYNMLVLEVHGKHQGGIEILFRNSPHWKIKAYQSFGTHVLSFQLVMGCKRWFIVRCYVLPGRAAENEHIVTVINH